jgi:hypothetical protein
VSAQRAFAVAVLFAEGVGAERLHGGVDVHAGRHVEQDGHRLRRGGLGVLVEFDLLVADLELRLVDHFAVHGDPAALDEQLGLPAGATDQFDEAFGEANRVSHDRAVTKRGGHCTCLAPVKPAHLGRLRSLICQRRSWQLLRVLVSAMA